MLGTGKTLAFVLPLLARLSENVVSGGLILTPTRELATQISVTVKALLSKMPQTSGLPMKTVS